jgi:hypothetical protein
MFEYWLTDTGIVKAKKMLEIWGALERLQSRINRVLEPWEAQVVNLLIELNSSADAIENGLLTETGILEMNSKYEQALDLMTNIDNFIELDSAAHTQLENLLIETKKTNPDATIESILSNLILSVPK